MVLTPDLRIAVVCSVGLLLSFVMTPSSGLVSLLGIDIPGLCAFKLITSLDCPGCGLTRSVIYAVHGQFYYSYLMHLWGIPIVVLAVSQIPYRLYLHYNGKQRVQFFSPVTRRRISHFVLLSFLLPWIAKTVAYLVVRYC